MPDIHFEDYSMEVKDALKAAGIAWLYEAAGIIEAQTKRNTPVDTGQLKGSWQYRVDESAQKAVVGSPLENAIWNEFGTGEYALNGDGRKGGYWVYVKGGSSGAKRSSKSYTLWGAKQAVAILRDKGLDAHYTKGKRPQRSLYHAFESKKNILKNALLNKIKGVIK